MCCPWIIYNILEPQFFFFSEQNYTQSSITLVGVLASIVAWLLIGICCHGNQELRWAFGMLSISNYRETLVENHYLQNVNMETAIYFRNVVFFCKSPIWLVWKLMSLAIIVFTTNISIIKDLRYVLSTN